jgi:hypothetical protein
VSWVASALIIADVMAETDGENRGESDRDIKLGLLLEVGRGAGSPAVTITTDVDAGEFRAEVGCQVSPSDRR